MFDFTRAAVVLRMFALCAAIDFCAHPCLADDPALTAKRPVRLRAEWGGTTPHCWSGLLEISEGRLEHPVSLGIEADEPGTIWIDRGAVWLQRSSRIYDGFDVTVVAPLTAMLTFTLQSTDAEAVHKQFTVSLADLERGEEKALEQDDENLRLVMRRAPGDSLVIDVQRPHLVFAPSEKFAVSALLDAPISAGHKTKTELAWRLRRARSSEVLRQAIVPLDFAENATGSTRVPLTIELPDDEGAYDIEFAQCQNGTEIKQRVVQVIVLDTRAKSALEQSTPSAAELVDSFKPGSVNLLRRVVPHTSSKVFSQAVAGLLSVFPRAADRKQKAEDETTVKWDAYKLAIRHPGRPHRLVVSLNSAKSQSVGISVLEPNAADQLMPVGLDSGVHVVADRMTSTAATTAATTAAAVSSVAKHEILFWPKVVDPVLLLHDIGTAAPIDVASVEVFELLPPVTRPQPVVSGQNGPARMTGPYMHKPLLPENFGGQQALDPQSGRSLYDWATFHQSALHTAEYLHQFGYNSLLLAALADGSTIYPSDLLQPTPRYDTGTFFSSGQDPLRKDILELMLRVFDREGLTLVPELQFSTPLPALERMIAADNSASCGIELIGADGRSWRESQKSLRGLAPYYNPLDPRVQQAVVDVVNELAGRYRSHASFAGLAVEISSRGYLQLPGLEWGYDDGTIDRFCKATGVSVPADESKDRHKKRYELLTGQHQAKWVRWRSEELARFHRRLADSLHAYKPQAQFVLACTEVLGDGTDSARPAESARTGRKLDSLLAERGITFDLYSQAENFTVLRPTVSRTTADPLARMDEQAMSDGAIFNSLSSKCRQGNLFFQVPSEYRVADFDKVSPWQPAYTWLVTHASTNGTGNRKRYADALAGGDAQMLFDGGWLIPLGQEQSTTNIRKVIAQLPAVPFHVNKIQRQPITVRVARCRGETWIYAVNQVPYSVTGKLHLTGSPQMTCTGLPDGRRVAVSKDETGKMVTPFQVDPYDAWACKISDTSAVIDSIETEMPADSLAQIAARIKRIDRTISDLRQPSEPKRFIVQNPGFERQAIEKAGLKGWELPATNAAHWALDVDNPRSGNSSLVLTSASDDGAALSSALQVDAGMRLFTMSVWLRSDQEAADVRLVFSADAEGKQHVRYLPVTVNAEWKHYRFRVTDIPGEQLANAKIRIEIRGPGKLWIDDIDIHQNKLSPEDLRQITKTHAAITIAWSEGRYADCQRLLDSYWGQALFEDTAPASAGTHDSTRAATGLRHLLPQ